MGFGRAVRGVCVFVGVKNSSTVVGFSFFGARFFAGVAAGRRLFVGSRGRDSSLRKESSILFSCHPSIASRKYYDSKTSVHRDSGVASLSLIKGWLVRTAILT